MIRRKHSYHKFQALSHIISGKKLDPKQKVGKSCYEERSDFIDGIRGKWNTFIWKTNVFGYENEEGEMV